MVEADSPDKKRSLIRGPSLENDYFMGLKVSAYFQADIKKAIVIGCSKYD